jgi:hypothetical protein
MAFLRANLHNCADAEAEHAFEQSVTQAANSFLRILIENPQ